MRPKPNKPPPEVQRAQKNWPEINARSFEVLQIKLGHVRSHYSRLPGIGEQYRILTTPDPRPELKTARMRANIQALKPIMTDTKKRGKGLKRIPKVLITEGVLAETAAKSAMVSKNLDDKMLRQKLLGMYEQQRLDNKELNRSGNNEDGYWGLKKQMKKTVLQVKMPEIIKQEERSKTRHVSIEKQVEILQTQSKGLSADQDSEMREAILRAKEERRDPNSCDVSTLATIEEEGDEELVWALRRQPSDVDELEYYSNRPDIETITIDQVKKSRLIRGYDPPEMRMPDDVNKFIFEEEAKELLDELEIT